ncbi:Ig-like domain-containing protein [Enterobacter hormaechei]
MPDIKVSIFPENATNKSVTVVSSNPEVVSVGKNNKCKAEGPGEAELTITTADGGHTVTHKVVVKAAVVNLESLSLDSEEQNATVGDTFTVSE